MLSLRAPSLGVICAPRLPGEKLTDEEAGKRARRFPEGPRMRALGLFYRELLSS